MGLRTLLLLAALCCAASASRTGRRALQAADCTAVCPTGYIATATKCIKCDADKAYSGVLDKCLTICPSGYTDLGLTCSKPANKIFRACPAGMTDLGLICAKVVKEPTPAGPAATACPAAGLSYSPFLPLFPPCFASTGCSACGQCQDGLRNFIPVGHMVNTKAAVDYALANDKVDALELDLQFDADGNPTEFRHSMNVLEACDCTTLLGQGVCGVLLAGGNAGLVGCQARTPYAEMLAHLATKDVKLIYLDSHVDEVTDPAKLSVIGAKLYAALKEKLFAVGYGGKVLISAPKVAGIPFLKGALAAAKADAASGYVDRIHYTIDNEGATVLPTLLGALDTHNVMFAFGYPQIANDLGLVCTALAGHISAAANLYRQGALTGVIGWTVDDAGCWAKLKAAGATALLTNFPQAAWVS